MDDAMNGRLPDWESALHQEMQRAKAIPTPDPQILPLEMQLVFKQYQQALETIPDVEKLRRQAGLQFLNCLSGLLFQQALQRQLDASLQRNRELLMELIASKQEATQAQQTELQTRFELGQIVADLQRDNEQLQIQLDELTPPTGAQARFKGTD